jgi:CBS domain containing-hemolysin-like protein
VTLLLAYLALAIGVSFLCSLCEAALLTLTPADAELMAKRGGRAGQALRRMKAEIDRPLAAILTLNTVSHTVGAAGVGAQAIVVFGDAWIGLTSAILTLLILVLSEIIPKTIGATHARALAAPTTYLILWMIWLTWPLVIALNALSKLIQREGHGERVSREQFAVTAELARAAGAIDEDESRILSNLLLLSQTRAGQIMTPRTVAMTLPQSRTIAETLAEHPRLPFTRIPLHEGDPEKITGLVLKPDVYEHALAGKTDATLADLKRDIHFMPESATALDLLDRFGQLGVQFFAIVDERGTFVGVVTLEDVVETVLGTEIVDETDTTPDLRALAERRSHARERARAAARTALTRPRPRPNSGTA